jgi:hypothetical protein
MKNDKHKLTKGPNPNLQTKIYEWHKKVNKNLPITEICKLIFQIDVDQWTKFEWRVNLQTKIFEKRLIHEEVEEVQVFVDI